jgi:hypothetical protein
MYRIREHDKALYALLYLSFTQGKGEAVASKGTHSEGWAMDFLAAKFEYSSAFSALTFLDREGFAAVLRREREVGPGVPAHIHAALRPHSNSAAVDRANAYRTIAHQCNEVYSEVRRGGRVSP